MFTKEIFVGEELTNYVERLSREVEGSKEIISFMLENNKNISSDSFKEYKKEFDEKKAEFDIAKQEVQKQFVPQGLIDFDGNNTSWELDYATQTITIKYIGKRLTEEKFNAYFD